MTQANAAFLHQAGEVQITAGAALNGGEIQQLADGRACVRAGLADSASGDLVTFYTSGVFDVKAASGTTFAAGETVWWDESAEAAIGVGSAAAGDFPIGVAVKAKVSGETAVEVDLNVQSGQGEEVLEVAVAASSAVTNTTTETEVGRVTIPANTVGVGTILDFFTQVIATATNGTDTFRVRIRKDSITGEILADSAAVDLADNDVVTIAAQAVLRTIGGSGTFVAAAQGVIKTTPFNTALGSTAIDTTTDMVFILTITESAGSASNSARADIFNVTKKN